MIVVAGERPVDGEEYPDDKGSVPEAAETAEECAGDATCVDEEESELRETVQESRERLREVEARAEEYLQQLQRVQAEFQNFKRRVERERERSRRQSRAEAVEKWLPVIDNLERVMTSTEDEDEDPVRRGVEMILRQIEGVLSDMGVERISTVGETFDPQVHEAVERTATEDLPEGTITQEYQAGYVLDDTLIRPARVQVAENPPEAEQADEEAACESNCED